MKDISASASALLGRANLEAYRYSRGANIVLLDYLLLAMLTSPDSVAFQMLVHMDASPAKIRQRLTATWGVPGSIPPDFNEELMMLDVQTRRAISEAGVVASQLNHPEVNAEHLLIGMLTPEVRKISPSWAIETLNDLQIDFPRALNALLQIMNAQSTRSVEA